MTSRIRMRVQTWLAAAVFGLLSSVVSGQATMSLNIEQATDLALKNSRLLRLARLKAKEQGQAVWQMKSKYFPTVNAHAGYLHSNEVPEVRATTGAFGVVPGVNIPLPPQDMTLLQGNHDLTAAGLLAYQPIIQLSKIHSGVGAAKADAAIAAEEARKAELQIKNGVLKLYFGILISQKQRVVTETDLEIAQSKLHDVQSAVKAGKTVAASEAGLQASVAMEEQNLLKINFQIENCVADFRRLLGLSSETDFVLDTNAFEDSLADIPSVEWYRAKAADLNPDLRIAGQTRAKAGFGVSAAYKEYLPDLGLIAGYSYQHGLDYYARDNVFAGVILTWNILDWGSRYSVLKQRHYQRSQAVENLANVREQTMDETDKAYRSVTQAAALIVAARKAAEYRREDFTVQDDKHKAGLSLPVDWLTARGALARAEADLLSARCNYRLALSELEMLTGGEVPKH